MTLRGLAASLLVVAAASYLLAGVLAWFFAERLIFQPPPPSYGPAAGVRLVPVEGGDVVAVRWLPRPAARHTILLSHGNAEDLGDLGPFLRQLHEAGFGVLAYDYRGYGLSTRRTPSERRAYADHAAAYRYLTGALGVPPGQVILHGRSLGGGVASELAARCPAAGLVLESTFTSTFRVMGPPVFPFDRFATLKRMPRIRVPVLVIHGGRDDVIPQWHGRLLHGAGGSRARALWVEEAGHNDMASVSGERYVAALRDFAASLPAESGGPAC